MAQNAIWEVCECESVTENLKHSFLLFSDLSKAFIAATKMLAERQKIKLFFHFDQLLLTNIFKILIIEKSEIKVRFFDIFEIFFAPINAQLLLGYKR